MVIGYALVSNVRRIKRYLEARIKLENERMKEIIEKEHSKDRRPIHFLISACNFSWFHNANYLQPAGISLLKFYF